MFDLQGYHSLNKIEYRPPNGAQAPKGCIFQGLDDLANSWRDVAAWQGSATDTYKQISFPTRSARKWRLLVQDTHGAGACVLFVRFHGGVEAEEAPEVQRWHTAWYREDVLAEEQISDQGMNAFDAV